MAAILAGTAISPRLINYCYDTPFKWDSERIQSKLLKSGSVERDRFSALSIDQNLGVSICFSVKLISFSCPVAVSMPRRPLF